MSASELRAGASLAGVFGLRMLGLFLILPVFALHAPQLAGGDNLVLVGIALGAYGLSQAILHIPFGMASDRWGRKPVIYTGLLIFAAGSFLAASADDIWSVIAGRTLQGAGAISSAVVALAADLTREQHRTKTMAMIGASIGLVFALSLVAAPALYRWIGMAGLFSLTGLLSLGAIWMVKRMVPDVALSVHAAPEGGAAMPGGAVASTASTASNSRTAPSSTGFGRLRRSAYRIAGTMRAKEASTTGKYSFQCCGSSSPASTMSGGRTTNMA